MNILSVGLTVCDILIKPVTPEVFTADSIRLDSVRMMAGGDALNVAVQMSKLGERTKLVGAVGDDPFGGFLIQYLNERKVDASALVTRDGLATSTSVVMIAPDGERHFAYHGKANDTFSPNDVSDEDLKWADAVHVGSVGALKSLEGEGLVRLFQRARRHKARTSLDITWSKEVDWAKALLPALPYTDLFLPSLYEAKEIAGSGDLTVIREFFSAYRLQNLIVKLGAEGCYATDFAEERIVPIGGAARVVDTTGAGDSFVAGFLYASGRGYSLERCARYGHAVSAYCIGEIGATTAEFSLNDIESGLKE